MTLPVVLLHGQGGWAGMWLPVVPELADGHQVVAPDLPGLGASGDFGRPAGRGAGAGWRLGADRAHLPGAAGAGGRLAGRLDRRPLRRSPTRTGCPGWYWWTRAASARFRPAPGLALAMIRFIAQTSAPTGVLPWCGGSDAPPGGQQPGGFPGALSPSTLPAAECGPPTAGCFGSSERGPIPPEQLAHDVPTALDWGRHDRVMRLRIAEEASARYDWPLHVIEDAGHFLSRPAGGVPGGATGRAR